MNNVDPSFIQTVTQNGKVFGVPTGTAMGGGILYNKKIYQQLGLSVPKTWADFEANNDKIKKAGIAPVIATYGDTWTSQLFVLADYYNVQQAHPSFATDYTANKAKYATTPEAMEGFTYLKEGFDKGWWQQDYATTKFEQGLKLLADGKGAHSPMLSFALSTIATNSPDEVNDIGFFAQPGTDASKNGVTIWMPAGTYIAKTSKHIPEAMDFLAFIASTEGVDAITAKVPPAGPYLIRGSKLPDNVLPAVKDIAAYIDAGDSAPALEFLSPIKGPSLEQICVAVSSSGKEVGYAETAAKYEYSICAPARGTRGRVRRTCHACTGPPHCQPGFVCPCPKLALPFWHAASSNANVDFQARPLDSQRALPSQPLDESAAPASVRGRVQGMVERALRQKEGIWPMTNPVIESIRRSLGRTAQTPLGPRPAIYDPRQPGSIESEIECFLHEVKKRSGVGQRLSPADMGSALWTLVAEQNIHKATVWETLSLGQWGISEILNSLGVDLVSPNAGKQEMALCDLGVTEADYLLPETGTLVLKSSAAKPRGVSLLPRVHLALVRPEILRADMHQVFAETKDSHYLVLISGPSRTADIELTTTLGVHGPKSLYVWMIGE